MSGSSGPLTDSVVSSGSSKLSAEEMNVSVVFNATPTGELDVSVVPLEQSVDSKGLEASGVNVASVVAAAGEDELKAAAVPPEDAGADAQPDKVEDDPLLELMAEEIERREKQVEEDDQDKYTGDQVDEIVVEALPVRETVVPPQEEVSGQAADPQAMGVEDDDIPPLVDPVSNDVLVQFGAEEEEEEEEDPSMPALVKGGEEQREPVGRVQEQVSRIEQSIRSANNPAPLETKAATVGSNGKALVYDQSFWDSFEFTQEGLDRAASKLLLASSFMRAKDEKPEAVYDRVLDFIDNFKEQRNNLDVMAIAKLNAVMIQLQMRRSQVTSQIGNLGVKDTPAMMRAQSTPSDNKPAGGSSQRVQFAVPEVEPSPQGKGGASASAAAAKPVDELELMRQLGLKKSSAAEKEKLAKAKVALKEPKKPGFQETMGNYLVTGIMWTFDKTNKLYSYARPWLHYLWVPIVIGVGVGTKPHPPIFYDIVGYPEGVSPEMYREAAFASPPSS